MVNSVVGGAIEDMANAVVEGVGKVIASFGTMWVNIGTPVLTGGDGGSAAAADAGFSAPVLTVLGYITWIGYAVAIIAMIALAAVTIVKIRRGEGMLAVGRLGIILAAVILIGAASGLVADLLPSGPVAAGGAVAFLQGSLWWIMLAVAVGATIVGAVRMAVTMRAEPGKDVFFGLVRLIIVAGAGVGIVALLVQAADAFSVWIIDRATDCNLAAGDSTCFGRNISNLLVLTTSGGPAGTPGLGALLVIILGVIAIIVAVAQIVLMLARGGMLVVLTGILPLSAAAAMSGESGKGWFNKNVAWLIAFILYKPAAAIIYAAAFQLAGTDVFKDDGTGLISVITGLMMMILALVALPALMRFVTPMVGAMAGGAGGGMLAAAGVAAVPSGAAQVGRLSGGSGGGSSASPSTAGATGSTGSAGSAGSAGAQGQSGAAAAGRGAAAGSGAAAGGGAAAAGGGA
ncbi:MAG: hypothetical protein ACYC6C_11755, partial [Coriobacteriia bacterium]